MDAAEQALIGAAEARGWRVLRVRVADGFRRLMILGEGKVLVDLAVDASPTSAPILTQVGPTLPARDLVGRKVIALFDRAAARDFVDVYRLAEHFGRQGLLTQARRVDAGFSGIPEGAINRVCRPAGLSWWIAGVGTRAIHHQSEAADERCGDPSRAAADAASKERDSPLRPWVNGESRSLEGPSAGYRAPLGSCGQPWQAHTAGPTRDAGRIRRWPRAGPPAGIPS